MGAEAVMSVKLGRLRKCRCGIPRHVTICASAEPQQLPQAAGTIGLLPMSEGRDSLGHTSHFQSLQNESPDFLRFPARRISAAHVQYRGFSLAGSAPARAPVVVAFGSAARLLLAR